MMYKLFDPYKTGLVGPRFEHAVRNAMLTAMSDEGSTFIEVMRILTDARYVQELLPKVTDPIVRRYWTDQIAQTADFHLDMDSPAIDAGTGAYSTVLKTDYDGIDRPQFEQYDIGAYEYHIDASIGSEQLYIPLIYQR